MTECPTSVVEFLMDNGIDSETIASTLPKWQRFGDLLQQANREFNLTRINDDREFWIKHVADSLALVGLLPNLLHAELRVCDVGCGGGLPAIPLACLNPALEVGAVDGTGKKINFVKNAAADLQLSNLTAIWGRSEELQCKPKFKQKFDLVTLRAVGAAPKIIPKCHELLDPELGMMILYKTPNAVAKEKDETYALVKKLKLNLDISPEFELPENAGARQFMIIT